MRGRVGAEEGEEHGAAEEDRVEIDLKVPRVTKEVTFCREQKKT